MPIIDHNPLIGDIYIDRCLSSRKDLNIYLYDGFGRNNFYCAEYNIEVKEKDVTKTKLKREIICRACLHNCSCLYDIIRKK
jgi:hypothetical protein